MNRKVSTVVSLCLVPLGLFLMIIGFLMGAKPGLYLDGNGLHFYEKEKQIITLTDIEQFENLDINFAIGDVQIYYADEFKLEYQTYQKDDFTYEVKNKTLILTNKKKGIQFFNFGGNPRRVLKLYLPQDLNLLDAEVNLGSMRINELKINSLSADVDCGNLSIRNVSANKADLKADLGSIEAQNFVTKELTAKVSTGNLKLNGTFYGDNDLKCDLGEVYVDTTLKEEDYAYQLKVSLGNITLNGYETSKEVTKDDIQSSNHLKVKASTGDIRIQFGE